MAYSAGTVKKINGQTLLRSRIDKEAVESHDHLYNRQRKSVSTA